jgi:CDP-glycerol glycerophosphotransferase (TagB/SpsB family)
MKKIGRYTLYFVYLFARLFLFPMYFLSGFVRRRADIWVFGSWGGHRFADNSAAFYLYCQREMADEVRLVWISREREIIAELRDRGFEAHWIWSMQGVLSCLRAKLYIFDSFSKDINFWTSRRAVTINLWSGVPLKTFERDIDTPDSRYYRLFHGTLPERWFLAMMMPWHVKRPDMVIAASPATGRITERAFDLQSEAVAITGYPRNDILFLQGDKAQAAKRDLPESYRQAVESGRRIFLYLPTYRDSGRPFFEVDWDELDRLMRELGATFFFKFHPDDTNTFRGKGEYISELPIDTDMLLDKPIIYYVPDLEEFASSSRSLNFEPADIAVGPICRSESEFMRSIADVANQSGIAPADQARWKSIRRRFNTYTDGESSRRTAEAISNRFLQTHSGVSRILVRPDPATEK